MDLAINVQILLVVIVFIGYTIQTISGFGAIIFALPLSLFFVERMNILPVFIVMSVFQSFSVAYKDREHLLRKEFIIMFTIAMIGMPLGMLASNFIPVNIMNIALGCFIIINSIYSLLAIFKEKFENPTMNFYHRSYPLFSGFLQGAYGVGGPMIGSYMDKVTHNKKTYRSMISLYWCFLNPFMIVGYLIRGELNTSHLNMLALLAPAVLLGVIVGNKVVNIISKKKFQIFIHTLLIFIGITLFI